MNNFLIKCFKCYKIKGHKLKFLSRPGKQYTDEMDRLKAKDLASLMLSVVVGDSRSK